MNCSTQALSAVLGAGIMARLTGDGIPIREALSEASLSALLHDILAQGFTREQLVVNPTHVSISLRQRNLWRTRGVRRSRRFPHHMLVSRELVEDGFVPERCIRGWSFVAEYAIVDRRRGRRITRRITQFSPSRSARNATIRNYCQRR